MTDVALNFEQADRIGRVASVDTSRVLVAVDAHTLLTRVGVGNLVAIQGATEREFLIGMTERVTRCTKDELIGHEDVIEDEITIGTASNDLLQAVLIGTYRTVHGEQENFFKRGADSFPQIDRDCYFIQGPNLQRFMGLLGADLKADERLQLGRFVMDTDAIAIANGDRFFQRHASILGSTGSGKSWSVALMLERASKLKFPNLIVLDMHGEYMPLIEGDGAIAEGFHIAGPGDLGSSPDDALFLPYWLLNREEMLSMLLDRSDMNAPNQASRFTLHVRDLKEKTLEVEKKTEIKKTFTVDSPIPYPLTDLLDKLKDDDTRKGVGKTGPVKGDWEGKLTRFISRLNAKIDDRRYGFMFSPPDEAAKYSWLAQQAKRLLGSGGDKKHGVKIVDFSEVPSDILPVVAGVFVRLLYNIQFWLHAEKRTPFTIICDEAHLYLPVKENANSVESQALYSFERIAKEGRKYGVSLLVVSQRPSDVSRTILSQCNNFLVLRLTNEQDQSVVRRLIPDSMSKLTDILPLLETGEALLLGDAVLLPTRIKLDVPNIKPASGTRDFWTEWGNLQSDEAAIEKAVETLRSQTRPD